MARKTIDVSTLVGVVNYRNKNSTCSPEVRQGWNSLLEDMLHQTGNYSGFGYLDSGQVPYGHDPGIVWHGEPGWETPREFPDETRRVYYWRPR